MKGFRFLVGSCAALAVLVTIGCEQEPSQSVPPAVPVQGKDLSAAQAEALAVKEPPAQPAEPANPEVAVAAPSGDLPVEPGSADAAPVDGQKLVLSPEHTASPTFSKPKVEGHVGLSLQELAGYEIRAPRLKEKDPQKVQEIVDEERKQIPAEFLALDGKKVAIAGYMLPTDFRQGKTNEFLLTRVIPSCFFCQQPMINEWVDVKTLNGERVDYPGDDPIVVSGTFSVGIERDKSGYVSSIYRLVAEKVEKLAAIPTAAAP